MSQPTILSLDPCDHHEGRTYWKAEKSKKFDAPVTLMLRLLIEQGLPTSVAMPYSQTWGRVGDAKTCRLPPAIIWCAASPQFKANRHGNLGRFASPTATQFNLVPISKALNQPTTCTTAEQNCSPTPSARQIVAKSMRNPREYGRGDGCRDGHKTTSLTRRMDHTQ